MSLPRYPGYDVLNKRGSPSWDEVTREVIEERLSTPADPRFFDPVQWKAVCALSACIVPQLLTNNAVPIPALLDATLMKGSGDGYRRADMPPMPDAWRIGLAALDAESRRRHELPFASVDAEAQRALLRDMQDGTLTGEA